MSYHQPPRHTVDDLTADRSLLDITGHVVKDADPIGVGAGGDVYKGTYTWRDREDGTQHKLNVAIKFLRGSGRERQKVEQRLNREISTWRSLSHPNVSELLGIANLNPNLPPALVSRWVQRNDFLAYIGRHPFEKRKKAQEIAQGLEYLHANNIVHGDMKVDNILISDGARGVAQITDFGIARILDVPGYTTMTIRNVRYAAPELRPIKEEVDLRAVRPTKPSDIYSLGILLLQLFHGPDEDKQKGLPYNHVPYNPMSGDFKLLRRIHKGERPIRKNYNHMEDIHWGIMEACWAPNPDDRFGIAKVLQSL